MGRLKTGTPPRLSAKSIDFSKFPVEHGDAPIVPFSFTTRANAFDAREQIVCHVLYTTDAVHDRVRAAIDRSPLYNGQIQGIGPRYCPSLEDKVMRFPDKSRHQIFLEPEGIGVDEIYVNGLSMSLPRAVQEEIVHTLPGLEDAVVLRHAYAVEYDFVQPTELTAALEAKKLHSLFFAGQINGTSGYEEAGAQGLIAGINAVRRVRGDALVTIGRDQGYIGILVDDLITQGCLEPYRMFTSRAEHRLVLRIDNADVRLTPLGREIGLVDDDRWRVFEARAARLAVNRMRAETQRVKIGSAQREAGNGGSTREARGSDDGSVGKLDTLTTLTVAQAIGRPDVPMGEILAAGAVFDTDPAFASFDLATIEAEFRYAGYLKRHDAQMARVRAQSERRIPENFVYAGIPGFSREVIERLTQVRPTTLGQAGRVPGVTPAALALLAARLSRNSRAGAT
jgi:tRNA uridine 5-carboxymethylaminomethyl modification enzyme